jgi:hypothetical protein
MILGGENNKCSLPAFTKLIMFMFTMLRKQTQKGSVIGEQWLKRRGS